MDLGLGLKVNFISTPKVFFVIVYPKLPVLAFFAKSNEKWFCEIVDDPWWFLDVLWCVLICFPLIFKGFMGFRWFPWCRGAPGANCPAGVRFACGLRRGCQSEIEAKSK